MARISIRDLDPRTGRPVVVAMDGLYRFTARAFLKENAFNGGATLLLAPAMGFARRMDEAELVMAELLDGTHTVRQTASALASRCGLAPADALESVRAMASELLLANLIEPLDIPTSRPLRLVRRQTTYSLENLEIVLTGRCTLSCVYCSHPTPRKDMPNALLDRVLRAIESMGVTGVLLTGGEPTLHPRFWELITGLSQDGVQTSMFTNGSTLSRRDVRRLADCRGVQVMLSLDTLDGGHCRALGQGLMSPTKLLRLVGWLKEAGVPLRVNTVLVPGVNCARGQIEDFLDTLDLHGVAHRAFGDILPVGRGKAFKADLSVFEAAFLIGRRSRETEKGPIPGSAGAHVEAPKHVPRTSCGVGTLLTSIDPEGDVHPCITMPKLTAGTVRDQSLQEIWEEGEVMALFRQRERIESPRCRGCPHWTTCCGGCRARAFYSCGSLTSPDPFACSYFGHIRRARRLAGV